MVTAAGRGTLFVLQVVISKSTISAKGHFVHKMLQYLGHC